MKRPRGGLRRSARRARHVLTTAAPASTCHAGTSFHSIQPNSAAAAAGFLLVGPAAAVLCGALALGAPTVGARVYRRRWVRRFDAQLVPALGAISGALRAGLTFNQAVDQVIRDAPEPLGRELSLFAKEVRLGVPPDEALGALAKRVGSPDLELVVVATGIARQLGGNLAEVYDTLATTARERFRLEGKIEALTAQGRLQGWIVAAMPLLLGAVLDWLRPDLVGPMLRHPFGWGLVGLVGLLECLGLVLIRRIVRIDV